MLNIVHSHSNLVRKECEVSEVRQVFQRPRREWQSNELSQYGPELNSPHLSTHSETWYLKDPIAAAWCRPPEQSDSSNLYQPGIEYGMSF